MQFLHCFYLCWFHCFLLLFFLYLIMNCSLSVFITSSSFTCRLLYKVILYVSLICASYICTYLHMYACKYTFLIYLLHVYCIFGRYGYDIVCQLYLFFVVYHQYSFTVTLITMEMLGIYYGWNDMALWQIAYEDFSFCLI